MPVNGNYYDWESVQITTAAGETFDATEISYDDSKKIESIYGKGGMPRGYGRGNYEAKGKLTMKREEFNRMLPLAGTYAIPPFPIVVRYANDDQDATVDALKDCKITARSFKAAQSDSSLDVELEFNILGGIFAGGLPPQNLL